MTKRNNYRKVFDKIFYGLSGPPPIVSESVKLLASKVLMVMLKKC